MPAHFNFRIALPARPVSQVLACFWIALAACSLILPAASAKTVLASATKPVPRAQRHEYRHVIDQLEDAWREAMVKSNSTALGALLADDYTAITANGAIQTKEQTLASLSSGALQISSLTISDRKVRIYGTTAVVTSLAELTGNRNDEALNGRYRYTRVYVRNPQGQWKIVSFEASRIQEPPDHK
jgi:ketosteroid isomerase-like protein